MAKNFSPEHRASLAETVKRAWADPAQRAIRMASIARAKAEGTVGRPSLTGLRHVPSVQITSRVPPGDKDLIAQVCRARSMTEAELLREYVDIGLAKDIEYHNYKPSETT